MIKIYIENDKDLYRNQKVIILPSWGKINIKVN